MKVDFFKIKMQKFWNARSERLSLIKQFFISNNFIQENMIFFKT